MAIKNLLNREISWLKFTKKIIYESEGHNVISDRLRFFSISVNNLNEFLVTRYALLYNNPTENLQNISSFLDNQIFSSLSESMNKLLSDLKTIANIEICDFKSLTESEQKELLDFFLTKMLPKIKLVRIENLSQLKVEKIYYLFKDTNSILAIANDFEQDFINVSYNKIISKKNLLLAFKDLYAMEFDYHGDFYVLKDTISNIEYENDDAINCIKDVIYERANKPVIALISSFDVENIFPLNKRAYKAKIDFLEYINISQLCSLVPDKYKSSKLPSLETLDLYKNNALLFYPYESFDIFLTFLKQLCSDPKTKKIYISLYRISKQSKIIEYLIEARKNDIEIYVLLELRARFDEVNNLSVIAVLKDHDINLSFGLSKYKTHAKLFLAILESDSGLKYYSKISTGNYNEDTAGNYSDIAYLSQDEKLGNSLEQFFLSVINNKLPKENKEFSFSPVNLKEKIIKSIEKEIKNSKNGKPASIWLKCNSLADLETAEKLIYAAKNGVKIFLFVRGICIIPEQENIYIKSILGKYLEHSRIFCFANSEENLNIASKIYISSSDLMQRNFAKRIEIMYEIKENEFKEKIIWFMNHNYNNQNNSWLMTNDKYVKLSRDGKDFYTEASLYLTKGFNNKHE